MSSNECRDFDLSSLRNLKFEIVERLNYHRNQLDTSLDNYQLSLTRNFNLPISSHPEYQLVKAKYEDFDKDINNFRKYANLWYEKAVAAAVEIKFMIKTFEKIAANKNYGKKGLKKYIKNFHKKVAKYDNYVRKLNNIKSSLEKSFKTDDQGKNRLDSFIDDLQIYDENSKSDSSSESQSSAGSDSSSEQLLARSEQTSSIQTESAERDLRSEISAESEQLLFQSVQTSSIQTESAERDSRSENGSSVESNQSNEQLLFQSVQNRPIRTEAVEQMQILTPTVSFDEIISRIFENEDSREPGPSSRRRKTLSPQIEESCRFKRARSVSLKSIFLLPNGFNSTLYWVGNDLVKISNTCGFDSIAQIFLAAITDDPCYEAILKLSKNNVAQFLLNLQKKTDLTEAVQYRDFYLVHKEDSNLKKNELGVWELNLFGALSRIWDTYYDSMQVGHYHFNCSCVPMKTKPKHFFSIVDKGINETDPEIRQRKINNFISDQLNELMRTDKTTCPNCRSKNYGLELEDQLYIEIISLNSNCTLKFFQSSLNFLEKNFRLAGVIDHKPKHFIAYVRRIDGSWQIYDDMKKTVAKLVNIDFKIRPETAIYVRE
ncbi:uncharacterized protein LOC123263528 isoform X1 [Cotesia glomerata]|uniref:uncharacterized protein LOC123263528 isoform X1 n=1 Tax=Cotesia glomerata TaxID=32391 RepID=UPI001D032323|nr:uncharacterized protein LOC123263528 isoform X1 [Cotesia glomerata]